jgi:DNA-binding beta-propeller fold protein YncE
VANNLSNSVTRLRASDGAPFGTFFVGGGPLAIGFDGANIWVADHFSDEVTELRASDGATLATFSVGRAPVAIALDGANVWAVNEGGGTVSKF